MVLLLLLLLLILPLLKEKSSAHARALYDRFSEMCSNAHTVLQLKVNARAVIDDTGKTHTVETPATVDADCAISRWNAMRRFFLYKNVSVC